MKVLLEAAHPAHVHFLVPIGRELIARGHEVVLAVRPKDVARELARDSGLLTLEPNYSTLGSSKGLRGAISQAFELLRRVSWLIGVIRRLQINLVVTRNPSGVMAATVARVPSIFDTDDGRAAGIHLGLAKPFATIITTPQLLPDQLGSRQRRYAGLKSTVFLHPAHFSPRREVLDDYCIDQSVPLIIIRFSANSASHDHGVQSVPSELVDAVLSRVLPIANVVISHEGSQAVICGPVTASELAFRRSGGRMKNAGVVVSAGDFLHLLAFSDLHVGDSGSVAMEAAALGVFTLRIADTRRAMILALGERYGLVEDYRLGESEKFLARLDDVLEGPTKLLSSVQSGHQRLLDESRDVVGWFADQCEELMSTQLSSG